MFAHSATAVSSCSARASQSCSAHSGVSRLLIGKLSEQGILQRSRSVGESVMVWIFDSAAIPSTLD